MNHCTGGETDHSVGDSADQEEQLLNATEPFWQATQYQFCKKYTQAKSPKRSAKK